MEASLKGKIVMERIAIGGGISSVANTLSGDIISHLGEPYTGTYVVTPNTSTQILSTAGALMEYDVTVNPIPNNYGLITWDGSELMVS